MPKRTRYEIQELSWKVTRTSEDEVRLGTASLPAQFDVRLTHTAWPAVVSMTVEVDAEIGPIARSLGIEPGGPVGLTYRDAHDLLVGTIEIQRFLRDVSADAAATKVAWEFVGRGLSREDVLERVKTAGDAAWTAVEPRRRRVLTARLLQEVAATYRSAMENGLPPTAAVAEHFVVSHSTAARWVSESRKGGHLGPARGTRPGEGKS